VGAISAVSKVLSDNPNYKDQIINALVVVGSANILKKLQSSYVISESQIKDAEANDKARMTSSDMNLKQELHSEEDNLTKLVPTDVVKSGTSKLSERKRTVDANKVSDGSKRSQIFKKNENVLPSLSNESNQISSMNRKQVVIAQIHPDPSSLPSTSLTKNEVFDKTINVVSNLPNALSFNSVNNDSFMASTNSNTKTMPEQRTSAIVPMITMSQNLAVSAIPMEEHQNPKILSFLHSETKPKINQDVLLVPISSGPTMHNESDDDDELDESSTAVPVNPIRSITREKFFVDPDMKDQVESSPKNNLASKFEDTPLSVNDDRKSSSAINSLLHFNRVASDSNLGNHDIQSYSSPNFHFLSTSTPSLMNPIQGTGLAVPIDGARDSSPLPVGVSNSMNNFLQSFPSVNNIAAANPTLAIDRSDSFNNLNNLLFQGSNMKINNADKGLILLPFASTQNPERSPEF
jgi:hypothetical protein